ncbi:LemA family protein [Ahrensia sp. R2A130]|uniref:LemA family protein n=1 Tax=Ahrensia sp. R2A130 TaxID=744979 RepID=UPI0001E09CC7|nr:LemA family protein [Ahrensia sp. R2A130]EFL88223.1 LemA protein [Ahrensia sp. R2A130]
MELLMSIIVPITMISPIFVVYVVLYNALRRSQTKVAEAWSGVEVQLKRRHDLIPNLLSSVKAAMGHEEAIFTQLTKARKTAHDALTSHDPQLIETAEANLSAKLSGLRVQIEDNPEITATGNVETFQKQLEEAEDQIAASRRLYNGNVQKLNAAVATFPGNLVAARHKIGPAQPFALEPLEYDAALMPPQLNFN